MPDALAYESRPPAPPGASALRIVTLAGLVLLGVQLWLLTDFWLYRPWPRVACYLAAIAACFLPPVQSGLASIGRWLSGGSRWRTVAIVAAVAAASSGALYATAAFSDRSFAPAFHDEFVYLLQAQMFAAGHLWLPAHPLGAFFDTFYVITDRAYAAQYFPGTALLLAPGAWLGLPIWAMPLALAGLASAGVFLLLRELFDGATALAGVVVLIGVQNFRVVSISPLSAVPAMLFGTLAVWTLLRWDRRRTRGWIVAAGVAIGWMAITRPLDAAVYGVAGAAFVAWRLRGRSFAAWRRVAVAGLLPLAAFAALQLWVNRGVTGNWFQTPFGYYAERDMPGTQLGFHGFDAAARPASALPQKQAFYDAQVVPAVRGHTPEAAVMTFVRARLYPAVREVLPDMLLLIVVPAALLAVRDARRWLVVASFPLWWVAYAFHVFLFTQYYVVLIVPAIACVFAGFDAISGVAGGRLARAVTTARVLVPVVVSVMAMPQFKRDVRDQWIANPARAALDASVATIVEPRAIVMVRYHPSAAPEQEVVYNVDAARPDDARAIIAHDLGDGRNVALYRYYAQRQPDRVVYRFDRAGDTLHRLGAVTDLAAGR